MHKSRSGLIAQYLLMSAALSIPAFAANDQPLPRKGPTRRQEKDAERIAKAEAKRQRRAAKRLRGGK